MAEDDLVPAGWNHQEYLYSYDGSLGWDGLKTWSAGPVTCMQPLQAAWASSQHGSFGGPRLHTQQLYQFPKAAINQHQSETTETYSLMILLAVGTKSRHGQRWYLLRAMREGSVPGLFLWLADGCLLSVSARDIPSMHISVPKYPLFIRTSAVLGQGSPTMVIINSITSVKILFPKTVVF